MHALLGRVREWMSRYPRLVRFAAVATIVVLVGLPIAELVPRGLDVDYDLGRNHRDYRILRVAYLPVGQDASRVMTVRFPEGAPATYRHHVELAPGRYEIHARLEGEPGGDVEEISHVVDVGRSTRVRVTVVRSGLLPGRSE